MKLRVSVGGSRKDDESKVRNSKSKGWETAGAEKDLKYFKLF